MIASLLCLYLFQLGTGMSTLTYALARAGEQEKARALADEALATQLPRAVRPHLTMTYAALGDMYRVVSLLREARNEGWPWSAEYSSIRDLAIWPTTKKSGRCTAVLCRPRVPRRV